MNLRKFLPTAADFFQPSRATRRIECVLIPPKAFFDFLGETALRADTAERRAANNGAWALGLLGLLSTSWLAALLWFLPK